MTSFVDFKKRISYIETDGKEIYIMHKYNIVLEKEIISNVECRLNYSIGKNKNIYTEILKMPENFINYSNLENIDDVLFCNKNVIYTISKKVDSYSCLCLIDAFYLYHKKKLLCKIIKKTNNNNASWEFYLFNKNSRTIYEWHKTGLIEYCQKKFYNKTGLIIKTKYYDNINDSLNYHERDYIGVDLVDLKKSKIIED